MLISTQVEAAMRCDGIDCHHAGAGHSVTAMQAAVAAATPSNWRDAIVVDTDSGWITLAIVDSGDLVRVWNHSDLSAQVFAGQPVALHGRYRVLAVGLERHSILPLD